jgi:hypothetical protein
VVDEAHEKLLDVVEQSDSVFTKCSHLSDKKKKAWTNEMSGRYHIMWMECLASSFAPNTLAEYKKCTKYKAPQYCAQEFKSASITAGSCGYRTVSRDLKMQIFLFDTCRARSKDELGCTRSYRSNNTRRYSRGGSKMSIFIQNKVPSAGR